MSALFFFWQILSAIYEPLPRWCRAVLAQHFVFRGGRERVQSLPADAGGCRGKPNGGKAYISGLFCNLDEERLESYYARDTWTARVACRETTLPKKSAPSCKKLWRGIARVCHTIYVLAQAWIGSNNCQNCEHKTRVISCTQYLITGCSVQSSVLVKAPRQQHILHVWRSELKEFRLSQPVPDDHTGNGAVGLSLRPFTWVALCLVPPALDLFSTTARMYGWFLQRVLVRNTFREKVLDSEQVDEYASARWCNASVSVFIWHPPLFSPLIPM